MSKYFSEEEKNQAINEKSIADKNIFEKISLYYNVLKDKIIIYQLERWIFTIVLVLIYIVRIFTLSNILYRYTFFEFIYWFYISFRRSGGNWPRKC